MQNANKTRGTGPLGGAMVSLWGASSLIRSVQRGTITVSAAMTNTATIAEVKTENCVLLMLGFLPSNGAQTDNKSRVRLALTNSTTITATVITAPTPDSSTVSYEIIEYAPGVIKSVQRGTITNTTPTATITAVDTSKSALYFLGNTQANTGIPARGGAYLVLTNATTVTMTSTNFDEVGGYQVVELF